MSFVALFCTAIALH